MQFVHPDRKAPLEDIQEPVTYPGARRPDRHRWVDAFGVKIAVCEWGDASGPPLFLVHGGQDFAGTYDLFAPILADAGWRVISWDHRGHGDSDATELYSWDADVRDALAVIDSTTADPAPVAAHSKGGLIMLQLAEALPHRLSKLFVIDGFPGSRPSPDVLDRERKKMTKESLAKWLDRRQQAMSSLRKPGTLDELARRRGKMNPRLSLDWLRYLVTIGARKDEEGWRWKLDPSMNTGGFGPWRPVWALNMMKDVRTPLAGVTATEKDTMGIGQTPEKLAPYLPPGADIRAVKDAGHFVHIEHPQEVADFVLEFLS